MHANDRITNKKYDYLFEGISTTNVINEDIDTANKNKKL